MAARITPLVAWTIAVDQKWRIEIGEDWSGGKSASLNSQAIAATDTWTHLAVTIDRMAGVMAMYVNGVLQGTISIAGIGNISSSAATRIGASSSGASLAKGLVDDVGMYRRVLSATEVANIFRANTVGKSGQHDQWQLDRYQCSGYGQDW